MHEIGHALGMWHEQQRADRDDHIRILYENLGSYVSQFAKLSTVDYGVPYDPQSVMHYSAKVCNLLPFCKEINFMLLKSVMTQKEKSIANTLMNYTQPQQHSVNDEHKICILTKQDIGP